MTARREKDERLPNGSVIHWSRRFKRKGRWRVPVRCGGCGQERIVATAAAYTKDFSGLCSYCGHGVKVGTETLPNGSIIYWDDRIRKRGQRAVRVRCGSCGLERPIAVGNAHKEEFSGLCHRCAQEARRRERPPIETLPNSSVIYWSQRVRHGNRWGVLVRCGGCGQERTVALDSASGKKFSGLCSSCGKTPKTDDKVLANGSVIYWSQRFKRQGCWYVPIRCGICGQKRVITASGIHGENFTGRCHPCSRLTGRKHTGTGSEVLPSGSIIHWDDQAYDKCGQRVVKVRCGGPLCGGISRYVRVFNTRSEGYTGLCFKCSHYGSNASGWKGGRRTTTGGYIEIWLPPDHPFYCMANTNGYCLEHRLVMARHLGRPLQDGEIVHHINGDKQDNRFENLEIHIRAEYHPGYRPLESRPVTKGSTD